MNAYTSAPWGVLPDRNGCLRIGHGHNCTIALVYEPPSGFMEDNARLIASAPDLLAALRAIVKSLEDNDDEGMIEHAAQMIAARAAIAKATEAQP